MWSLMSIGRNAVDSINLGGDVVLQNLTYSHQTHFSHIRKAQNLKLTSKMDSKPKIIYSNPAKVHLYLSWIKRYSPIRWHSSVKDIYGHTLEDFNDIPHKLNQYTSQTPQQPIQN